MVEISKLISFLENQNYEISFGDDVKLDFFVKKPNNILDATESEITFINQKYSKYFTAYIEQSKARIIVVDSFFKNELETLDFATKIIVFSNDPKSVIYNVSETFFQSSTPKVIHKSALISDRAIIGKNCSIEPFVVIEDGVKIGDDCTIGSHTKIGKNVLIGNQVSIASNSVIGGDGFGYIKNDAGEYLHLKHFGTVIIEDKVEIGSNTCIDRGSLSDTIIRKGVKIDNLVHIAHNAEIGSNTMVIANSMIAGSVKIGENVWIAPSVSILNGLTIGSNAIIGLGSVVTKNVNAGTTVYGVPAKEKI